MTGERLDQALASRGLARSRTHAARLVAAGLVAVDGIETVKVSTRVGEAQTITVASTDHYVSRSAHKLVAALDAFGLAVSGRSALDVGASTGGFTQVLLERGAASVIALDVGHGQLDESIASDGRVSVVEGFNARFMTAASLAEAVAASTSRAAAPPSRDAIAPVDLVVCDVSFISITTILAAVRASVRDDADFVLLVKPQFEVGRGGIREGIVRQAHLRADAVNAVLWAGWDLGLRTAGALPSPIVGTAGNHEYLVRLSQTHGSSPTEWIDEVAAMTEAT
ncbi:TlyA family RNA methyltransferase [Marisediminicola sp. LYQ85]|uniref:TlyA family RNA methyltransferase n=1 Tax=Marisediminicola sp. LYQ85 TaxID=3391062 RepID=UPI003983836B